MSVTLRSDLHQPAVPSTGLRAGQTGWTRTTSDWGCATACRSASRGQGMVAGVAPQWTMTTDGWRVLSLDHRDPVAPLEAVVELIDLAGTSVAVPYGRSDVVEALNEHQPAAVAVTSGSGGTTLVGAAVARAAGHDAYLLAFALHPGWRHKGIGSALFARTGPTRHSRRRRPAPRLGAAGPGGRARLFPSRIQLHRRPAPVHPSCLHGPRGARRDRAIRRPFPARRLVGRDEGILDDEATARTAHRGAVVASRAGRPHRAPRAQCRHAVRTTRNREDHVRSGHRLTAVVGLRRASPLPPRPGIAGGRLVAGGAHRTAWDRTTGVLHRRSRRDRLGPRPPAG